MKAISTIRSFYTCISQKLRKRDKELRSKYGVLSAVN